MSVNNEIYVFRTIDAARYFVNKKGASCAFYRTLDLFQFK